MTEKMREAAALSTKQAVAMTAADLGCREAYTCQAGRGDPPQDCIYPDCPCGDVQIINRSLSTKQEAGEVSYTPDQQRAAEYIAKLTDGQVGGGDDPVGFLIASHAALSEAGEVSRSQTAQALEDCTKVLRRGIAHCYERGRTCCAQTLGNEIDNIRALSLPAPDGSAAAAAAPFDQGLTHQSALNIVRGLRAIYGTYPMVMEAAAEIERQIGANIALLAGLHKICEPITAMGDADSVSACQDLHELICMTAQDAISRAALIEMPSKDKDDLIAERLADSLIDYIRAPYSRSWLVERINAAIKRDTGEALRPLGASGSEVPWSLTSAPLPPADIKQDADDAARAGAVANVSERVATPLPAPDAGWSPPPDYELGKWHGLEEAAKIFTHGEWSADAIRAAIRTLRPLPAPPVGDGSS